MKYIVMLMILFSRLKRVMRISFDEMWSYVGWRKNAVWIITGIIYVSKYLKVRFVAMRRSRDRESLREVIDFLPEADEYHTDGWRGYEGLFEGKGKHVVHKKNKGYVNLNEGFHNLLRIHSPRLRRKGHAYSKSPFWHMVEILALIWRKGWAYNTNYNAEITLSA